MSFLSRFLKPKKSKVQEVQEAIDRILTEPESIDEMIPACKDCLHCELRKDQSTRSEKLHPHCRRPVGSRLKEYDWTNGIVHHIVARVNNWCWAERRTSDREADRHHHCGKDGQYFKAKSQV